MTTQLVDTDGSPIEHAFEVVMTPRDAASILAVGTRTLSIWADQGKLRCTRTKGGHRRYPADAVRAALAGRWEDAGDTSRSHDQMSAADVYVIAGE